VVWLYQQAVKLYRRWYPASHKKSVAAKQTLQPKPAPIDPKLRSVLEEYYEADVRALSRLVRRDLNVEWGIAVS